MRRPSNGIREVLSAALVLYAGQTCRHDLLGFQRQGPMPVQVEVDAVDLTGSDMFRGVEELATAGFNDGLIGPGRPPRCLLPALAE
jgi:hypothetical protein